MKKTTLLILLSALVLTIGVGITLAVLLPNAHKHDFQTTYVSDATHHWHKCNGCEEKSGEALHIDEDNNDYCDVCNYKMDHTHIYGAPTYTWSQDNSTCLAERVCSKDATHKESETINASNAVTTSQSCVNDEITTYTAIFTKDGFITQTKTEKTKDKLGHDFTNGAFVSDATHHWKKCSRCDVEDTEHKVAHSYDLTIQDDQYFSEEATCEHGKLYFKSCECGECGTETFDNGEIGAHSYTISEASPEYLVSNADCENPATYYKSCEYCGLASDILTFVVGNALGHDFTNGTFVSDATHHWKKCSRCDAEDTEHKVAHSYSLEIQDNQYFSEEATCEHGKLYFKSCECGKCGTETFDNGEIGAHSYTISEASPEYLVSNADCENPATYYKSCEYCGLASDTLTFDNGDALGHQFSETWTYDETGHWKEAICEHHDLKSSFAEHSINGEGACSVCDYTLQESWFQIFKNAEYLPDYTEDFTFKGNLIQTIQDIKNGVEGPIFTRPSSLTISNNSETKDSIFYNLTTNNQGDEGQELDCFKQDGDNYKSYYCCEDYEEYDLKDESYFLESFDIYAEYYLDIMNKYRAFDSFSELLEGLNGIGSTGTASVQNNNDGTFTLTINSNENNGNRESEEEVIIIFNNQKIKSVELNETFSQELGTLTILCSNADIWTFEDSFDSETFEELMATYDVDFESAGL